MKGRVRVITVLLIALVLVPSAAPAALFPPGMLKQFIPKLDGYEGFLVWDTSYESDNNMTNNKGTKTTDLFMREKLELAASGYIYHPRFILFLTKLSAGVKHESFSSAFEKRPFDTLAASEYEFRTLILPEHPYNLELYTLKMEPLTKRTFSGQAHSTAFSSGGIFRYKKKPYFFNAHYQKNSIESGTSESTTQRYGLLGTYYKELSEDRQYSVSAAYDHTNSTARDFAGSSDEASLSGAFYSRSLGLSSGLVAGRSDQGFSTSGISTGIKNLSWNNSARVKLPWNFSSDLTFSMGKDEMTSAGVPSFASQVSNTRMNGSFGITHRLYESLISSYKIGYSSLKSDTGEGTTTSNAIGFNYTKKIPWGRLRSSFSTGSSTADSRGVQIITNEPHSGVAVPGNFRLNSQDVNSTTVTVWLRSPEVQGEQVLLREGADYAITPFGNTLQINLLTLPLLYTVPGTYDFVVSYSLNETNSRIGTKNLSYSISLELFKEAFVPYYNHSESNQSILSGSGGLVPLHITSDAFGFSLRREPYKLVAEYQKVNSNVNPSKSWRVELEYQKNLTLNTQLMATVHYSSTDYPQGTSQGGPAYTDKLLGGSVGVQQKVPKKNLFVSMAGAYSYMQGLTTSTVYSLNSSLVWSLGKIYVSAGATMGVAESEYAAGKNRRTNQYYFMNVKRKLF